MLCINLIFFPFFFFLLDRNFQFPGSNTTSEVYSIQEFFFGNPNKKEKRGKVEITRTNCNSRQMGGKLLLRTGSHSSKTNIPWKQNRNPFSCIQILQRPPQAVYSRKTATG
jgi:hypothetical protein